MPLPEWLPGNPSEHTKRNVAAELHQDSLLGGHHDVLNPDLPGEQPGLDDQICGNHGKAELLTEYCMLNSDPVPPCGWVVIVGQEDKQPEGRE